MRSTRWFKSIVTVAALGLMTATSSAQAANIPARSTSSLAPGYCSPVPRPATGNVLSNRPAAGELCSPAGLAYVPAAGGWRIAGPATTGGTLSLVAFVAQPGTWRDAGASQR